MRRWVEREKGVYTAALRDEGFESYAEEWDLKSLSYYV